MAWTRARGGFCQPRLRNFSNSATSPERARIGRWPNTLLDRSPPFSHYLRCRKSGFALQPCAARYACGVQRLLAPKTHWSIFAGSLCPFQSQPRPHRSGTAFVHIKDRPLGGQSCGAKPKQSDRRKKLQVDSIAFKKCGLPWKIELERSATGFSIGWN